MTSRPAFCGTVPKLGALSRVPQDVSCVPHFNYVFFYFFSSQKFKYQNKKYIQNCDWHLKIYLRDDDCVDGAKDVRTSSRPRAPLTEMVERTRKNTIFSFHKPNSCQRNQLLFNIKQQVFGIHKCPYTNYIYCTVKA